MFEEIIFGNGYPVDCVMLKLKHLNPRFNSGQLVLIYCVSGEVEVSSGSCRGTLKAGDLLFINRGEIYYAYSEKQNAILVAYIEAEYGSFLKKGSIITENTPIIEEIKDYMLALAYMQWADPIFEYDDCMAVCSKFVQLVHEAFTIKINGKNSGVVQDVLKNINQHFNEKLSVDKMAQRYGLSSKNLNSILKKAGSVRVFEYLTYIRCTNADLQLYKSQGTAEEIAEYCGFTSYKMFSKYFKEFSGKPPKQRQIEYRKLHNHKEKWNIFCGDYTICQVVLQELGRRTAMRIKKSP